MWLARKITYSKWAAAEGFGSDELPADHVGKELRTTRNTLSFWSADGPTAADVREAALALVLSLSRLDAIDVTWVSKTELERDGISLSPTPGQTKLTDRVNTHYDAVSLDVRRLGTVAGHLAIAVRQESRVWKLTKLDVVKLVASAVDKKRIGLANLPADWRAEVAKHVSSS